MSAFNYSATTVSGLILEKAVNHGAHGEQREASLKRGSEKSMTCVKLLNYSLGDVKKKLETQFFRRVRRARCG